MALRGELHSESLLDFDGTVYRFSGGYEISLEIRRMEPTEEIPHGFRYSFVLRGPGADGKVADRILAYDNSHAPSDAKRPHDHLHKTKRGPGGATIGVHVGVAVRVETIDELIGQFLDECWKQLLELGVDVDSLVQATVPARETKKLKSKNVPGGHKGAGE